MKIHHLPARLSVGAYLLNSGLSKFTLDEETSEKLQDKAAVAIPEVKQLSPNEFGKALAVAETATAVALVTPIVPAWVGALGLGAFSAGLMAIYFKTPGMTKDDGVRPTRKGDSLAKNVWMCGIAGSLLLDEVSVSSMKRKRARKQAKAEKKARKQTKALAKEAKRRK